LQALYTNSPKLFFFFKIITDRVIKNKLKYFIFCLYPATQFFLYGTLKFAEINIVLFTFITPNRKVKLDDFNKKKKKIILILIFFAIYSTKLNL